MNFEKEHVSLKYYLLGRNYFYALKALNFAKKHHTGTRKDKVTPEIKHQYDICLFATTLKDIENEELLIVTILLHDILEDYDVEKNQIVTLFGNKDKDLIFGQKVLDIVWRLTKVYKGVKKTPEEYFNDIAECPIASVAKGADRINNMNTMLGVFSVDKVKAYLDEVNTYFFPMLKKAKYNFPEQSSAYFNIIQLLRNQVNFVEHFLKACDSESTNLKK